ncbi:dihydroxyacetone kinase subunit DhaL [Halobacillus rhizosphaerae]|uniref:dihydroxyacetone kinase subunit DhaL n=1 Tax=Halobacillus rhizosphaerae TaxID=3064889 RepID=UPI00398B34AF
MFTADSARKWIQLSAKQIQENKDQLSQLDQTLGDGDHGLNMERGFNAAVDQLDQDTTDAGKVLKGAGTSLLSKIGGASGPLYGTFFMKAGTSLGNQDRADVQELSKAFRTAVDNLKKRGKTEQGEKTMVDVLEPVTEFMEGQKDTLDPDELEQKAADALNKVIEFEAKKGRAAYYKDKSIGKQDAGAQSAYYLIAALATVLKEGEE